MLAVYMSIALTTHRCAITLTCTTIAATAFTAVINNNTNSATARLCKSARDAVLKLSRRPKTAAEVIDALQYLRRVQTVEGAELRAQETTVRDLVDFIHTHGCLRPDLLEPVSAVKLTLYFMVVLVHSGRYGYVCALQQHVMLYQLQQLRWLHSACV
jgi:cell division protein FtsX